MNSRQAFKIYHEACVREQRAFEKNSSMTVEETMNRLSDIRRMYIMRALQLDSKSDEYEKIDEMIMYIGGLELNLSEIIAFVEEHRKG